MTDTVPADTTPAPVAEGSEPLGPGNPSLGIFWISVLGLFLEMLLIRWVSTEVRIFAYLQNTVLVVCFLGLGMGCFTCRGRISFRLPLILLAVLALLFAVPQTRKGLGDIGVLLSVLEDMEIWYGAGEELSTGWMAPLSVLAGLLLSLAMMVMIWEMFVPIGRVLGRLMDDHPHTIWAYSINVAGSLAGIWLYAALSALTWPPGAWFGVLAVLMLPYVVRRGGSAVDVGLLAVAVVGAVFAGSVAGATEVRWSPYQKLVLMQGDEPHILVNNVGYQQILDLRPESVAADPERFDPDQRGLSQYDIPMLIHPSPRRVLIVGAGSGNDASGALRGGAERVVAVEIDPVIVDMGSRHHPEKPYQDPRVTVVNDDARAYFARSREQFDLVIFGLLDSHTTGAMNNVRLDHFVYTRESIAQVHGLLAPGGMVALTFATTRPFIADRMARILAEEFGERPMAYSVPASSYGWGGAQFVAGDLEAARAQLAQQPRLVEHIEDWREQLPLDLTYTTPMTTDDWPYLYLQSPRIPTIYWLLGVLLLLLAAWGRMRLGASALPLTLGRTQWHFFLLGAAFMLLEVANISRAASALGSTWTVNAVIISGVMVMILAANALAAWLPNLPSALVYVCLCVSAVGLYFVDIQQFSGLPFATKAALVGSLTTLPMLFSGIVFIRSFTRVEHKETALGANLIGALAGGLLQSLTFVTGLRFLLLLVAAMYFVALLLRPPRTDGAAAA